MIFFPENTTQSKESGIVRDGQREGSCYIGLWVTAMVDQGRPPKQEGFLSWGPSSISPKVRALLSSGLPPTEGDCASLGLGGGTSKIYIIAAPLSSFKLRLSQLPFPWRCCRSWSSKQPDLELAPHPLRACHADGKDAIYHDTNLGLVSLLL